MKKYLTFFVVEWQQAMNYRPEALVWFILEFIPLVVMVNLSTYLLHSGRLDHTQYSQLVIYFILNLFVSRLSSIHFEDNLIDDIKDGKISSGLLKPYSYFWHLLPRETTWRLTGLMYLIPSFFILWPLIKTLNLPQITPYTLLLFCLFLVIAYFQRFFIGWIISIPSFWFEQSKVLIHLKWMCEGIFGGAWLPLYLFPLWWQNLAKATPFYYWFYFPIQLLLGNVSELLIPTIVSLLWVVILYFISRKMWHTALKHYSSVGG